MGGVWRVAAAPRGPGLCWFSARTIAPFAALQPQALPLYLLCLMNVTSSRRGSGGIEGFRSRSETFSHLKFAMLSNSELVLMSKVVQEVNVLELHDKYLMYTVQVSMFINPSLIEYHF